MHDFDFKQLNAINCATRIDSMKSKTNTRRLLSDCLQLSNQSSWTSLAYTYSFNDSHSFIRFLSAVLRCFFYLWFFCWLFFVYGVFLGDLPILLLNKITILCTYCDFECFSLLIKFQLYKMTHLMRLAPFNRSRPVVLMYAVRMISTNLTIRWFIAFIGIRNMKFICFIWQKYGVLGVCQRQDFFRLPHWFIASN